MRQARVRVRRCQTDEKILFEGTDPKSPMQIMVSVLRGLEILFEGRGLPARRKP